MTFRDEEFFSSEINHLAHRKNQYIEYVFIQNRAVVGIVFEDCASCAFYVGNQKWPAARMFVHSNVSVNINKDKFSQCKVRYLG